MIECICSLCVESIGNYSILHSHLSHSLIFSSTNMSSILCMNLFVTQHLANLCQKSKTNLVLFCVSNLKKFATCVLDDNVMIANMMANDLMQSFHSVWLKSGSRSYTNEQPTCVCSFMFVHILSRQCSHRNVISWIFPFAEWACPFHWWCSGFFAWILYPFCISHLAHTHTLSKAIDVAEKIALAHVHMSVLLQSMFDLEKYMPKVSM